MDDRHRRAALRSHIESIAREPAELRGALAVQVLGRAWPAGHHDRSEPVAVDWLRRWHPRGPAPLPPACTCAAGGCALCN